MKYNFKIATAINLMVNSISRTFPVRHNFLFVSDTYKLAVGPIPSFVDRKLSYSGHTEQRSRRKKTHRRSKNSVVVNR